MMTVKKIIPKRNEVVKIARQVIWGKIVLETFISEACLSQEEEWIMRTRVAGWSRTRQAYELHISLSSLDKHIAILKKKYDAAAKLNPLLPPRRKSAKELWMDTH